MKKGLTNEMIDQFNNILKEKGSIIRLDSSRSSVDIKLIKDKYLEMEDQVINPNKEFYDDLQDFFYKKHGLKLTFNNTWSCFWATNLVNVIE
jgi:hypothetical protein